MGKRCVIYANCQGAALGHFLNKSAAFRSQFQIDYLINYLMISQKEEIPRALLQSTDLFIYQPLAVTHGLYSTEQILHDLPPHCRIVSFPYLYNDALWPLFRDGKKIVNQEPITALLESGATPVEVVQQFLKQKIDFQFARRFQNTLRVLAERERFTTLKAVDYILANYKTRKLFLIHNHPSSFLLLHLANQLLELLDYPTICATEIKHPNEAQLPGYYPPSPYEIAHFQIAYRDRPEDFVSRKSDFSWRRCYLQSLIEICLNRHSRKSFSYQKEKVELKLWRSFTKLRRTYPTKKISDGGSYF